MAWASSLMMYQEVPIREEWEKRIDQDIYQKSGWNTFAHKLDCYYTDCMQVCTTQLLSDDGPFSGAQW